MAPAPKPKTNVARPVAAMRRVCGDRVKSRSAKTGPNVRCISVGLPSGTGAQGRQMSRRFYGGLLVIAVQRVVRARPYRKYGCRGLGLRVLSLLPPGEG